MKGVTVSDVIPFTYEGSAVRTLSINGEPWFVLADLCKVLGIKNVKQLRDRLDDALCQTYPILDSLGRTQNATIVSEAGMYEVVIRSDKPEAANFRRWITTEVLPSIRKTGSYGVAKQLTADEIVAQALQITSQRVEKLQARLSIVEPKATAFDLWLSSNVDYGVGSVAKALALAGVPDMGRTRLFRWLADNRWAFRTSDGWEPYQTQIETKRLGVKFGKQLNTRTGEQFATKTLRITAKGAAKLAALMDVMPEHVAEALDQEQEVAA